MSADSTRLSLMVFARKRSVRTQGREGLATCTLPSTRWFRLSQTNLIQRKEAKQPGERAWPPA